MLRPSLFIVLHTGYIPTGCEGLDNVLQGLPRAGVSLLYGESGTGKTTLALQVASQTAKLGSRTLFIDTDNTFHPERLDTISGQDPRVSQLIFVSKPVSFSVLTRLLSSLESFAPTPVALIVVDTMTSLYRREMNEGQNLFSLNRELNLQLAYLAETAKTFGLAVLITSQVRNVPKSGSPGPHIEPVAARLLKFWSQLVIKLASLPSIGLKEFHIEKADVPRATGAKVVLRLEREGFVE